MNVTEDLVREILRVEAITGRALTPKEADVLKAGRFLRQIAPYLFPDDDVAARAAEPGALATEVSWDAAKKLPPAHRSACGCTKPCCHFDEAPE